MSETQDIGAMLAEARKSMSDGLGKELGLEGWHYRDLPNMTPDAWRKLEGIIGPKNVTRVTWAKRTWPDGATTERGQVMISPEGIANLTAHAEQSRKARETQANTDT